MNTPNVCPRKGQGDANCDGAIDGVDYSMWLNSQCRFSPTQTCVRYDADFNQDGHIDDTDYQIWLDHLGLLSYPGPTDRPLEVSSVRPAASNVTLFLEPSPYTFGLNEIKTYELKATFSNGSPSETVDHFKTEISFSPQYLRVPADNYVDTSQSGFRTIFIVYGPTTAGEDGKIVIELDAGWSGNGPSTVEEITIARIDFEAIAQTPSTQILTIGNTQVVNDQGEEIPVSSQVASYMVVPSVVVTSVWTTDGNGDPKSEFDPGDSIRYNERFYNSTGSWQTVYYSLLVDGPCGSIGSWSENLDMAPGAPWLYAPSSIPSDACGGPYTYQLSVTYDGLTSSRSTKFTVSGVDAENPVVNWVGPAGNGEVYQVGDEVIQLEGSATDNVAVSWVSFARWDAVHEQLVEIDNDYSAPYRINLDCSTLNDGWNQINVTAYDTARNASDSPHMWLDRVPSAPTSNFIYLPIIQKAWP